MQWENLARDAGPCSRCRFPRLVYFLDCSLQITDQVFEGPRDSTPCLADQDIIPTIPTAPPEHFGSGGPQAALRAVSHDGISDFLGAGVPDAYTLGLTRLARTAL